MPTDSMTGNVSEGQSARVRITQTSFGYDTHSKKQSMGWVHQRSQPRGAAICWLAVMDLFQSWEIEAGDASVTIHSLLMLITVYQSWGNANDESLEECGVGNSVIENN